MLGPFKIKIIDSFENGNGWIYFGFAYLLFAVCIFMLIYSWQPSSISGDIVTEKDVVISCLEDRSVETFDDFQLCVKSKQMAKRFNDVNQ